MIIAYNLTSPPSYIVSESGQKLYVVWINPQAAYVEGKPDELNELNEGLAIRMQMTMDRYSRSISTLSNLLKAINKTAEEIVQNMK